MVFWYVFTVLVNYFKKKSGNPAGQGFEAILSRQRTSLAVEKQSP
jgi:hypothetical protein